MLAGEGIQLDETSPAFLNLQRMLHRARLEHERRVILRQYPLAGMALDPAFARLTEQTILQPVSIWTLSKVMDEFGKDASRKALRGKSVLKRNAQWRVIREFFGPDTDLANIDRRRIREFMDLLKRLPSNASKHFPAATIFEAAELAEKNKLPLMSADTANSYLRQIGALFRYAVDEGMVKSDPSSGLLLPRDGVRNKDKRLPFTTDDLRAIFTAPLYTGAIDDAAGYSRPGPNIVRRGRFWVPLIALFSGMRLNEICQLTLDDFVREDDADIILIRGEDDETKRIKTEAGHRFVPVHPELRRIGLMAYVGARRTKGDPTALLFPELPLGSTGYRSDPFSKFYAQFLDKVGVIHPKKVFHSYRHNYRDALREADISDEKVRALGGWTTGRTEDDYGSGLRPRTLAKDIEAIRYSELDLRHLYQEAAQ
ncbi:integrase [Aminobacter niigataensis]|uniref:Integrase n=1 Tax=Aminobacter niigataensis TaxID=83265 RepID=A0ABR6L3N4_9HYPH|nr:tyrosine-type recombinase/integrase [Aminobacter niigataensis]MBB4651399.1 integrase [Aminobacter niigataensis]